MTIAFTGVKKGFLKKHVTWRKGAVSHVVEAVRRVLKREETCDTRRYFTSL